MKEETVPLRHRLAYHFAHYASAVPLMPYHCHCEQAPELKEPCLILSNHLTECDLFILFHSFPQHMYFVCGEHLYRTPKGPFFKKYYEPIPAGRGAPMLSVVMQVLQKLKSGISVTMFPEGSRSFNGVTMPVGTSVGKLVKKAGCGLVTYKILGGYFTAPRWAYKPRKGYMEGKIEHIYSSEELKTMTAEEITDCINRDLYEDAYERQRKDPKPYDNEHGAEGLENYLEICPECGAYDSMETSGSHFRCAKCSLAGEYDEYGFLHGTGGHELPFDNVRDWGYWMEKRFDEDMDKVEEPEECLFTEQDIRLYSINAHEHTSEDLCTGAELKIYRDRVEIGGRVFDYAGIKEYSMLYFGKSWLFTHSSGYFGITGEHFHAWKLDRLYRRYKEAEKLAQGKNK